MRIKLVVFYSLLIFHLNAQYGVSIGSTFQHPLGIGKTLPGLLLGLEVPRDDESSLTLRFSYYLKAKDSAQLYYLNNLDSSDFSTNFVNGNPTINCFYFEGGTRRYILGTYDNGFSLYGSTNLIGAFNKVSIKYEKYDESKYRLANPVKSGGILNVGVGLNGGVKYTIPALGTVFFDASIAYYLRYVAYPSTLTTNLYSPLIFNFNLGFRREFY